MARSKKYMKYIFCLETELDEDLKKNSSSKFMLDQLNNFTGIKYIHRKCATIDGFRYYLKKISLKKYSDYSIIYFSTHGEPNSIWIGNTNIELNELSEIIGNSLENKIFHFGSCETIKITDLQLMEFFDKTDLLAVSGFTKEVDFVEGSALEFLYFSWCQEFLEIKSIEKRIFEYYFGLTERTGFKIIHRK